MLGMREGSSLQVYSKGEVEDKKNERRKETRQGSNESARIQVQNEISPQPVREPR